MTSAVSGNKDDLADVEPLLDQAVTVRSLVERQLGADHRADPAVRPQPLVVISAVINESRELLLRDRGLGDRIRPDLDGVRQ